MTTPPTPTTGRSGYSLAMACYSFIEGVELHWIAGE
jgi:hypothetical protein